MCNHYVTVGSRRHFASISECSPRGLLPSRFQKYRSGEAIDLRVGDFLSIENSGFRDNASRFEGAVAISNLPNSGSLTMMVRLLPRIVSDAANPVGAVVSSLFRWEVTDFRVRIDIGALLDEVGRHHSLLHPSWPQQRTLC